MTLEDKVQALVQGGMAEDPKDAITQLLDMGEVEEYEYDLYVMGLRKRAAERVERAINARASRTGFRSPKPRRGWIWDVSKQAYFYSRGDDS